MSMKLKVAWLALLLISLPPEAKAAGRAHCAIAATPLAFGKYQPASLTPADFTATLTVTCTASGPAPVNLEGKIVMVGFDASGRKLRAGPRSLRYRLYRDPARMILWGDGTGDSANVPISGLVAPDGIFRQTVTVYGRLLARQSSAAVGRYVDAVTVELHY